MSARDAAIEVRGLRKSYGALVAVDNVDLTVEAGEIFGFLGPNGAGKTTTIEILEGYKQQDSGTVRVLGLDPAREGAALRQQIGVMLQETAVYPQLTVLEALALFAGYYRQPADPTRILALIDLEEKRDSRVRSLSGGQRRRLDLGLALVGAPRLLFLDEPTVGFDPQARREAWEVIQRQREMGLTVFLTTQAMDEAATLCDRVGIIERGRIIALDTPQALQRDLTEGVRLSFTCAAPLDLDEMRGLDGVRVATQDGAGYMLVVSDPTEVLHRLTGQALARGASLDGLVVAGATLEDVFLRLTGHEARV